MKRMIVLGLVLFTSMLSTARAQQMTARESARHGRPVYYDTFSQKWLDPGKWIATGPYSIGGALECVREIQNGHLRLALREFGATDSDSDFLWTQVNLDFVNPNTINSITTDVVLRSFSGVGCSTNSTNNTYTQVRIGGYFFNTGTGDPADDVLAELILAVDTSDPKTIHVGNWNYLGGWTDIDSYPVGTPLTATFAWDKVNHQFIAVVKVKGDPGPGKEVVAPYSFSDTRPPVSPLRRLDAGSGSLNCTSAKTFVQAEAFFDNVMINAYPLPAK